MSSKNLMQSCQLQQHLEEQETGLEGRSGSPSQEWGTDSGLKQISRRRSVMGPRNKVSLRTERAT